MTTTVRTAQVQAFGPEPCVACKAAAGARIGGGQGPSSPTLGPAGESVVIVDQNKEAWITIELVDDENRRVAGEAFKLVLPNGREIEGRLDNRGKVRLEGLDPGNCEVTFPNLDSASWTRR